MAINTLRCGGRMSLLPAREMAPLRLASQTCFVAFAWRRGGANCASCKGKQTFFIVVLVRVDLALPRTLPGAWASYFLVRADYGVLA